MLPRKFIFYIIPIKHLKTYINGLLPNFPPPLLSTPYYVKLSETKVHIMNGASIIMHAIVTVIGQDRVGIIAGICVALAGINVNVLDISQTILGGMFTMVMLVDIKEASVPFGDISNVLDAEGERLGMTIRIQREDIFNAMHRI